ncbi:MAG TPA: terminase small subunit [Stellaceae bacterium]|nr:terminase small subunit [Stellaceae bacterium]
MSCGNHKRRLSPRQQKFVEQYLITGVASQAAIRAGYSPASAWSAGSRLRRNPKIAKAIRVGRANEARRAQIAHERVLLELARVAFSDIGEVLDWTGGDDVTLRPKAKISPHHRAAIAEIVPRRMGKGPRIKFHNKARALEALARHLGIFDNVVPAVPPDARRDGRDARTILVERLKRLARTGEAEHANAERAPSPPERATGQGEG